MVKSSSSKKRKYKRLALEISVRIKPHKGKAYVSKAALLKTKNLSKKGLFVMTPNVLAKDTAVDVELHSTARIEPVKLEGRISWIADKEENPAFYPGMGIEITKITPKDKKFLSSFMSRKVSDYKDAVELKNMYLKLKVMASILLDIQERHESAIRVKKVLDRAIIELDQIAHVLDREVKEIKEL
jgi:hypothetical protein